LAPVTRRASELNWFDSESERNAVSGVKGAAVAQMGYSDTLLVVVDDLDILCAGSGPTETQPILVVHSNAVVAGSITLEFLEAIAGGDSEILQPAGDLQLTKFASSHRLDGSKPSDASALRQGFCGRAPEGDDHGR